MQMYRFGTDFMREGGLRWSNVGDGNFLKIAFCVRVKTPKFANAMLYEIGHSPNGRICKMIKMLLFGKLQEL